jgi:hypothetical protein
VASALAPPSMAAGARGTSVLRRDSDYGTITRLEKSEVLAACKHMMHAPLQVKQACKETPQ